MTDQKEEPEQVESREDRRRRALFGYEERADLLTEETFRPEDEHLIFYPPDNIKVSTRKRKREKKEKLGPDDVDYDDLSEYAQRSVSYFTQPSVRLVHKYREYNLHPMSKLEIKRQEYEVDKDVKLKKSVLNEESDDSSDEESEGESSNESTSEYEDSESDEDEEEKRRKEEEQKNKEEEKERKKKEKLEKKKAKRREKKLKDPDFNKEIIKLVTPSFSGTKNRIQEHFRPYFFHLYHNLKNPDDYQWSGGAEKSICLREHKKRDIAKKPQSILVRVKKFETSFQEKYGDVEPLFMQMALYDTKNGLKISEDFYFDFNKEETLDVVPPQRGVRFSKEKWKNKALFHVQDNFQDTVLVVLLYKILEGKEDQVLDRYVRPGKFRSNDLKKLQKTLPNVCERLGYFRQPVCYGLLSVFDDEDKVILQDQPEKQTFIRLNGNQNMLKILSNPNMMSPEKRNSLTGSKKIKTVTLRLKLDVLPLGSNFNPIHKGNNILSINNRVIVRDISRFERGYVTVPALKKLDFVKKYNHNLFVYPIQLVPKLSRAKNVTIRVQIKDNDDNLMGKDQSLPLIYGRSSQDMLISTSYSYVSYKKKNPEFNDEFKIKLPSIITPKHHVLFVFFNVMTKKSSSKSILTRIGSCAIPLLNKNGTLLDGPHTLPLVVEYQQKGGGSGGAGEPKKVKHYLDPSTHKKIVEKGFEVDFRNFSSIAPRNNELGRFFNGDIKNPKKLVKQLDKMPHYMMQHLPIILNQMFEVMCRKEEGKDQHKRIFEQLIEFVHGVTELFRNFKRCTILWDYISYHFVNPKKVRYPVYFQLMKLWLDKIVEGQKKRNLARFNLSIKSREVGGAGATPNDQKKEQDEQSAYNDNDRNLEMSKRSVLYKSLLHNWFLFDLIYKSMVLEMKDETKKKNVKKEEEEEGEDDDDEESSSSEEESSDEEEDSDEKKEEEEEEKTEGGSSFTSSGRFFEKKFNDLFCKFSKVFVKEVFYRRGELTFAKDLNQKYALFLTDMMNVYHRGQLLVFVHDYLASMNKERKRVENHSQFQELCITFCRIIADYEHFVPMCLPHFDLEYKTQFSTRQFEGNLLNRSYIAGMIIEQITQDVLNPTRSIRERPFVLLRDILVKHEYDARYKDDEADKKKKKKKKKKDRFLKKQSRVFQIYFPFVLQFLELYQGYVEIVEAEMKRYKGLLDDAKSQVDDVKDSIDEVRTNIEKEEMKKKKVKQEFEVGRGTELEVEEKHKQIDMTIGALKESIKRHEEELEKKKAVKAKCEKTYEEEVSKVRIEKQNAFISVISILYHMDRDYLLNWCRVENYRSKFVVLMDMFKTIVELFEYRGEKTIRYKEKKYGVDVDTSSAIDNIKKQLEDMYSPGGTAMMRAGGGRSGTVGGRFANRMSVRTFGRNKNKEEEENTGGGLQRKMTLRERRKQMNRLSMNRRQGSIMRRSLSGAAGGAVGADGAGNDAMAKEEEKKVNRVLEFEKYLSSEVPSAVQEIILDQMRCFYQFEAEHGRILTKVYEILLLLFQTNQSDNVTICNFRTTQVFLDIYRSDIFSAGTPFSEGICKELMKKLCSANREIQQRAAACFYVLVKNNSLETGKFTRVKIQATTILSKLVAELSEVDTELLSRGFDNVLLYAEIDQQDLTKRAEENERKSSRGSSRRRNRHRNFPAQLKKTIDNLKMMLFNTRKIPIYKNDPSKHDKLKDLFLSLSKGSKEAPELSCQWFRNLCERHEKEERFIEASQCLLFVAAHVFQYFILCDERVFFELDFNLIRNCFVSHQLKDESFKELSLLFKEASNMGRKKKNQSKENISTQAGPTGPPSETRPRPSRKLTRGMISQRNKASQHFASHDFTKAGFIKLIYDVIELFDKAAHYEYKIQLFKLLEQFYRNQTPPRYDKLVKIYQDLSNCCKTISQKGNKNRFFGTYYMIEFANKNWPGYLRGNKYIYKTPKLYRLRDVMDMIRSKYGKRYGAKNIVFESSTYKMTEKEQNDTSKVWCLIQHVDPYYEERIKELLREKGEDETHRDHLTYFELNSGLKYFIFETPFTKGRGKKLHSRSLADQYKKKTIIEAEYAFPSLKENSRIVEIREVILLPIQNSIEIVDSSLSSLRKFYHLASEIGLNVMEGKGGGRGGSKRGGKLEVVVEAGGGPKDSSSKKKKLKVDVNSLQMVLTGTVIPTVQEGVPAIVKLFFQPRYVKTKKKYRKFIKELRGKLRLFLEYAFVGIVLNEKHMDESRGYGLHEQFLRGYFKLWKLISPRVGKCGRYLRPLLKYLDSSLNLSETGIDFEDLFSKKIVKKKSEDDDDEEEKKDEDDENKKEKEGEGEEEEGEEGSTTNDTKSEDENEEDEGVPKEEELSEAMKRKFRKLGTLKFNRGSGWKEEMKKQEKKMQKRMKSKDEDIYANMTEEELEELEEIISETEHCEKLNKLFDKSVKLFIANRQFN